MIDVTYKRIRTLASAAAFAVLLSGCTSTGAPNAQLQSSIDKVCQADATIQPQAVQVATLAGGIATVVAPTSGVGPAVGTVTAIDVGVLHGTVQGLCAQYQSSTVSLPANNTSGVAPSGTIPPANAVAAPQVTQ